MLGMRRRPGETVIIGQGPDEVRVTVVGIEFGDYGHPRAKLAIDAPSSVPVDREEVRWRKEQAGTVVATSCEQGVSRLTVRRRIDESIIIGSGRDEVLVKITRMKGRNGPVTMCIDAPPWIPVDREEIRAEKLRQGTAKPAGTR